MRTLAALVLGLALLGASGCGDETGSTTAPTTTSTATLTELFLGSVEPGGTRFYSFTVVNTGTVSLLLASLTPGGVQPALGTPMQFGFGVPQGTGCGLTTSIETAAGLTAQITNTSNPGIYCVSITDNGRLTASADFAIRIIHP